jgi:multimeric flavodoxin WrbA
MDLADCLARNYTGEKEQSMKILGICCSPRKNGNTEILLNEALLTAQKAGADTELFTVAGKDIRPCLACDACREKGICAQKDDMQPLYEKMLAVDGIIFGTPVYFYNMTAQCKTIMDRSVALSHPARNLNNKVGGIIVVAASFGNIDAVKDLGFYLVSRKMLYGGYISAYAMAPGDVKQLEKCVAATRDLGKGMVKLVKMGFKYPPELMGMSISYGTWAK